MIDDMDSFEEKIRDCSENLASIELPEGHKARFRRRLLNSRKAAHRAVLLRWSSSAVAACLVIALSVLGAITYQQSGEPAQADNSQMVTPGYGIYVDYMFHPWLKVSVSLSISYGLKPSPSRTFSACISGVSLLKYVTLSLTSLISAISLAYSSDS